MARIGLLMSRAGEWNGKQVMPKNWSEYLTTLNTKPSEMWPPSARTTGSPSRWGYGAMWWVWDSSKQFHSTAWSDFDGSYTAMGTDGQFITVITMDDMVIAHKNANIDQTPDRDVSSLEYSTILQMLLAARCGDCK
jgi:hypothetical protein